MVVGVVVSVAVADVEGDVVGLLVCVVVPDVVGDVVADVDGVDVALLVGVEVSVEVAVVVSGQSSHTKRNLICLGCDRMSMGMLYVRLYSCVSSSKLTWKTSTGAVQDCGSTGL